VTEKSTLNELKEQERLVRKKLILQAAMELFSTNQVSNVSVRDIAKKAGVSPALIYRHFEDRDELFVEAFLKQSDAILSAFEKIIKESKTVSVETLAETFVTYLLDNDDFFQMMTHFMLDATLKNEALQTFNKSMRRLLDIFDTVFKNSGIKDNVRTDSQALFSSLNGLMITYRNYPGRSKQETKEHVLNLTKVISSKFVSKSPTV